VAQTLAFFEGLGLVTTGEDDDYVATPRAIQWVNANSYDVLRDVIAESWIGEVLNQTGNSSQRIVDGLKAAGRLKDNDPRIGFLTDMLTRTGQYHGAVGEEPSDGKAAEVTAASAKQTGRSAPADDEDEDARDARARPPGQAQRSAPAGDEDDDDERDAKRRRRGLADDTEPGSSGGGAFSGGALMGRRSRARDEDEDEDGGPALEDRQEDLIQEETRPASAPGRAPMLTQTVATPSGLQITINITVEVPADGDSEQGQRRGQYIKAMLREVLSLGDNQPGE
jgi:hypothetical protein